MFQHILFDLDGTLLGLDLDLFLKEYFALLTSTFLDLVPGPSLKEQVLAATRAMVENTDGNKTNQEVFNQVFFQGDQWQEEVLIPRFDRFYRDHFPTLQYTAWRLPGVFPLLSLLFSQRKGVVIATNPIFPWQATMERMRWAGIEDFPFSLVTTYEHMHYCKPQLHYYREIMDMIHGEPQKTLMVGNDLEEDMVAKELGMTTFLLEEYVIPGERETPPPDHQGSFQDLYQYLQDME